MDTNAISFGKHRPRGITIIAVISFLFALLVFYTLVLQPILQTIFLKFAGIEISSPFFSVSGVYVFNLLTEILTFAMYFFSGIGLWKGKRWGYILSIIIYVFAVLSNFYFALPISIISIVIVLYLIFSKEVKAFFAK